MNVEARAGSAVVEQRVVQEPGSSRRGAGRKFWALIICLVAVFVCGVFEFDITMAVVGLYGLYVGGNTFQKVGMDFAENYGASARGAK